MSEDPRVHPSAQQAFLLTLMQVPKAQILAGPPGKKATEKPGEAQGEDHACPRVLPGEGTCQALLLGEALMWQVGMLMTQCAWPAVVLHTLAHLVLRTTSEECTATIQFHI